MPRKAATVDVEREDPLDLLDRRRDYRRGKRVAPVNRAVNRAGFLVDAHCHCVPVAVDAEGHLQGGGGLAVVGGWSESLEVPN